MFSWIRLLELCDSFHGLRQSSNPLLEVSEGRIASATCGIRRHRNASSGRAALRERSLLRYFIAALLCY